MSTTICFSGLRSHDHHRRVISCWPRRRRRCCRLQPGRKSCNHSRCYQQHQSLDWIWVLNSTYNFKTWKLKIKIFRKYVVELHCKSIASFINVRRQKKCKGLQITMPSGICSKLQLINLYLRNMELYWIMWCISQNLIKIDDLTVKFTPVLPCG